MTDRIITSNKIFFLRRLFLKIKKKNWEIIIIIDNGCEVNEKKLIKNKQIVYKIKNLVFIFCSV